MSNFLTQKSKRKQLKSSIARFLCQCYAYDLGGGLFGVKYDDLVFKLWLYTCYNYTLFLKNSHIYLHIFKKNYRWPK